MGMGDSPKDQMPRTVIGGRHGSPSVTIAWPFSKVTSTDTDLRAAVSELATLVSEMAGTDDDGTRKVMAKRAAEIAQELDAG
jgi:hypothetical protein